MSRAKGGAVKPVKCYAWIEDDRIEQVFAYVRTAKDVLQDAPTWTGGRWVRVEVRPVVARRRKPRKSRGR